jgi:uncharacterized protein
VKFLFWLAIICLVIWVLRAPKRRASSMPAATPGKPAVSGEPMCRCQYCGLHIPASEAVRNAEAAFCSEEHRRLHHTSH